MLTYIVLAVVTLVVVLLVVIALQPAMFRIERRATIPAAAADVFAQVQDLHKWRSWSPWEEIDPNLQRTYSGAAAGTGAVYEWVGNNEVGSGRMTILDCRPVEFIRIKLEFFKPFKGLSTAEFTFQPAGDKQTVTTWAMYGPKNFLAKALHMICNMEKMIGGQFEKGLDNLKSVVANTKSTVSAVNI
ncbi:MAG: SRPBCC family protein [Pirellulales bacterium]